MVSKQPIHIRLKDGRIGMVEFRDLVKAAANNIGTVDVREAGPDKGSLQSLKTPILTSTSMLWRKVEDMVMAGCLNQVITP